MKKFICLWVFLLPLIASAQFSDDFNDGMFISVPAKNRPVEWTGDVGKFRVNEALQLQLNASTTDSPVQLRTGSELSTNAYWECWMKMDFNPTASNYAKLFLCSDEDDLTGELNGLFIRVGYTNKNLCLVLSQKGKNNKTLIEGPAKRLDVSSVSLRLKATLNKNGEFNLYSKLENETDFVLEGTCSATDLFSSRNFGIACYFTSTRAKAFYFDDFIVRELRDDEQGTNQGTNPNLNTLSEGDVIFSEIMANPGGDNPEYIELYNASDKTFNLNSCLYFYGDKSYKLPEGIINPHEFFVLSKTTTVNTFPEGTNVFGVTSFPTLANSGKLLMFTTDEEELVSWFEYADNMYRDNAKKNGGWSLESIDLSNKSNTASNWMVSATEGGTPGRDNSVKTANPDTEVPLITATQILEDNGLRLTFSKPMNRQTLTEVNSYTLSDSKYVVTGSQTNYPQGTEVSLQFSSFPPQGELIVLELDGVRDLSGLALADKQVLIGSGHEAAQGDIVINEILFNPPTGGNEYVEIYNKSAKAFDLRFLSITSRKPSDGSLNKAYPLSDIPLLLNPGEYLVITKNRDLVCNFFTCRPESFFVELSVMPSLANTSGCAVLTNNRDNEIVDEFAYNEKMHAEGVSNKKGISLERSDFNRPSDDPDNWHSASAGSGFGTPGYQNSQFTTPTGIEEGISVIYPGITSDNYIIHYQLDSPGYRAKAYVYDSTGKMVTTLANNELLGTEGSLDWNGKGNSGQKLSSGVYIIYLEVYDMKGMVKKFRKPAVVK
jgi:hypothetical protein